MEIEMGIGVFLRDHATFINSVDPSDTSFNSVYYRDCSIAPVPKSKDEFKAHLVAAVSKALSFTKNLVFADLIEKCHSHFLTQSIPDTNGLYLKVTWLVINYLEAVNYVLDSSIDDVKDTILLNDREVCEDLLGVYNKYKSLDNKAIASEVKKCLQEQYRVDPDSIYRSALEHVETGDRPENVIQQKTYYSYKIAFDTSYSLPAFYCVALLENPEIFVQRLTPGVCKVIKDIKDASGRSILYYASSHNKIKIVTKLMEEIPELVGVENDIGRTPLHTACGKGYTQVAKILLSGTQLQKKAIVDVEDNHGRTALHVASRGDYIEIADILSKYANLNSVDHFYRTPAHLAAMHGRLLSLKKLQVLQANFNCTDKDGNSLLHLASWYNQEACVEHLVNAENANVQNYQADTPLHLAANYNSIAVLAYLLSKKHSIKLDVNASNKYGSTPLHHAAYMGHTEVIDLLFRYGADVNKQDDDGRSVCEITIKYVQGDSYAPLSSNDIQKIQHNKIQAAIKLINYDHSTFVRPKLGGGYVFCDTTLDSWRERSTKQYKGGQVEAKYQIDEIVYKACDILLKFLYGSKVDLEPLFQEDYKVDHVPIIHKVVDANKPELLRKFICGYSQIVQESAIGGNISVKDCINIKDKYGATALHKSAVKGSRDMVEILLSNGAEIDCQDYNLFFPLQLSVLYGNREVVQYLLERGADSNIKGLNGLTVLHIASENGSLDILNMLLKFGQKLDVVTDNKDTLLHSAVQGFVSGNTECWRVIEWLLAESKKNDFNPDPFMQNAREKTPRDILEDYDCSYAYKYEDILGGYGYYDEDTA